MPLLSIAIWLPVVGALLLLFIGNRDGRRDSLIRNVTLAVSLLTFAATLLLWAGFDASEAAPEFQFVERLRWIPAFGIEYSLGIDGMSLMLMVLTGFLTPIALLSSWEGIDKKVKEFSVFMLLLETAMLGVFGALDLFLFYVFWDFVLIPMYFLIGIWGYDQRIYAAVKFILYTMAGSVLMLVAIIGLSWIHQQSTGEYSFDVLKLYQIDIADNLQYWFFLAFTLAFVIKVPLFPFHTWLPDAHVQAPTPGSVILAGVMLKMGAYGLVRFSFPLFPEAGLYFAPYLAVLSVIAIVYGALVAMVQPDMKKLVAYSSVSHMGFVVLGISAMNLQGVQGATYQMLAHGVSTGGLFCIVGMLSDRRHTRLISEYGGIKKIVPPHRGVAHHHAGVDRAARSQRLHRRVPGHARSVPLGSALRRGRRPRRHPFRGVHALDVPAGVLRRSDGRSQSPHARPERSRVGGHRPAVRGRDLHGCLSECLPETHGAGDHADRPAPRLPRSSAGPRT
jgi:NADH-quinone oxidoreductase subunit M